MTPRARGGRASPAPHLRPGQTVQSGAPRSDRNAALNYDVVQIAVHDAIVLSGDNGACRRPPALGLGVLSDPTVVMTHRGTMAA